MELVDQAANSATSRPTPPPASSPAPDRRERRRRERHALLYRAAIDLFIERGYDATTMEDIGDRADVARATVFNHFPRKNAFIEEWARLRREGARAAVLAAGGADTTATHLLRQYLAELARMNIASPEESIALTSAVITNVKGHPPLADVVTDFVAQGQAAGEFVDVDPDQIGLLVATGFFATLMQWIDGAAEEFDLSARVLSNLDLLLYGVVAQEHRP